jgi:uncharacterized coiled-coil protein SlyX
MLFSNLERQGVNLAIDGNLIYADVSSRRVGINNSSPAYSFDSPGNVKLANLIILGNTITSNTGKVGLGSISNVIVTGGNAYDIVYTDGNGNLSWGNLQTLTNLEGFEGDNIPLGTNTTGSFSNALTFTTTTKITDAIAGLNELLGNITDSSGTTIHVASATVNGVDVYSNLSSTASNVSALQATTAVHTTWLGNLDANLGTTTTNITTLFSNAATQATAINNIDANVTAANSAISTLQSNVSTLFSNAAVQATWLGNLDANLGTATTNITTLFSNAATQATSINLLNANVSAANAAIATLQTQVYSNANVASYLTIFNGNINAGNVMLSGNLHTDYIGSNVTSSVSFVGSSAIKLPVGDTAHRPSGVPGYTRFNTDNSTVEYYNGSVWISVTNTVTDQTITGDDTNNVFTLDQTATNTSILVSINGTIQQPGVAYTVSGTQITFAEVPTSTDVIDIRFLGGVVSMNTTLSDDLTVSGNITLSGILSAPQATKTSTAPGTTGQICWDANYIYVCTATNTWKRSPLTGGY